MRVLTEDNGQQQDALAYVCGGTRRGSASGGLWQSLAKDLSCYVLLLSLKLLVQLIDIVRVNYLPKQLLSVCCNAHGMCAGCMDKIMWTFDIL